jgi:hypothetical protein
MANAIIDAEAHLSAFWENERRIFYKEFNHGWYSTIKQTQPAHTPLFSENAWARQEHRPEDYDNLKN